MGTDRVDFPMKWELASCPIIDRDGCFVDTLLTDDHCFIHDENGDFTNSVICKICGQKGYERRFYQEDSEIYRSEYRTTEPHKVHKCIKNES